MASLIPGFEYDIFISYRHNDNRSGWVSEFIENLKEELSTTIKDPISVYHDTNPAEGLLENHHVGKSLEGKLNCLILIPIVSQTYCDPKSFAWQHEFLVFNAMAKEDRFGREVKVSNGNFASRVLPVKIHDLDPEDNALLENELGGPLRSVDFIYKSAGVNRPMKPNDERFENLNRAYYRDQINKVANAVKEIILGLKYPGMPIGSSSSGIEPDKNEGIIRNSIPKLRWAALAFVIAIAIGFLVWIIASARSEPVADPDVGVPKVKSIIVLPFASLKSAQSADDYLEDGVTSAIVTELTKIKELSVISEAISRSFKNRENNLKTIAEEEHVNYVLQGSVQRVNDRVKISAQLIDVSTGFQLWADRFERKLVDIFAIQDDISSSIAKALKLKLSLKEKGQVGSRITESVEAYELFLKGKFYINSEKEADIDTSILYLENAVKVDPKFTQAYVELAWAYGLKNFWFVPTGDFGEKAFVAAEKVAELDSGLADGIFLRAFCSWTLKNRFPHEKVIREYKRALALRPSLDRAHNQLGLVYFHVDLFPEALEEAKMAAAIDPYSGFNQLTIATIYYYSNEYEKCVAILNEWPENFTLFEFRVSLHAVALINLGREQEADDILRSSLQSKPNNPALNSALAILLAKRGDRRNALKAIEKVEKAKVRANHFHHATYNIGVAYAMLNDKEKALYWLGWTAQNGFPCYSFFKNDPLLNNVQDYSPLITLLSELKINKDKYRMLQGENKK